MWDTSRGVLSLAAIAVMVAMALQVAAREPMRAQATREVLAAKSRELDQFVEVSRRAGIKFTLTSGSPGKPYIIEAMGGGVAWIDFDNDGFPDLFLVNSSTFEHWKRGESPPSHLYHNNRNGTFTDVTARSGLNHTGWGMGACVGDYNNDGHDDLYVTYYGGNVLYRNNGDGTFTDVTDEVGVRGHGLGASCAFGDYDNDGRLDLYVTTYIDLDIEKLGLPGSAPNCTYHGIDVFCGPRGLSGGRDILFHNESDGTFKDVTESAGIDRERYFGLGVVMGDFDRDGLLDIYVANDSTPSSLYRNNGDGTFTDVAAMAGVAYNDEGREQAGMGTDAADFKNDGWLDLVKGNFSSDSKNLYRNNHNGTFSDVAFPSGLGTVAWSYSTFGAKFLDYDNDGRKDFFLVNGHVYPQLDNYPSDVTYAERKMLFHNRGDEKFDEVGQRSGSLFAIKKVGRGLATADYDNDGDLEMLVTNIDGSPDLIRHAHKNENHSILIKAEGVRSNRDGIGAEIKVIAGGVTQFDTVRSGGSYLSSSELRVHFGLGKATRIDRLEVRWSGGATEVVSSPPIDRVLFVKEGKGLVESKPFEKARASSGPSQPQSGRAKINN
jgi:hypothetical protein